MQVDALAAKLVAEGRPRGLQDMKLDDLALVSAVVCVPHMLLNKGSEAGRPGAGECSGCGCSGLCSSHALE